jgi:hypothetical protein
MSESGPLLPSAASAGRGSYVGISCRRRERRAMAEDDPTPTLIVHRGDGASAITVFSGSEEGSNSSRPKIRVDQMHSETDGIMTKGIR